MSVTWQPLYERPEIWKAPKSSDEKRVFAQIHYRDVRGITLPELADRLGLTQADTWKAIEGLLADGSIFSRRRDERGIVYYSKAFRHGIALDEFGRVIE